MPELVMVILNLYLNHTNVKVKQDVADVNLVDLKVVKTDVKVQDVSPHVSHVADVNLVDLKEVKINVKVQDVSHVADVNLVDLKEVKNKRKSPKRKSRRRKPGEYSPGSETDVLLFINDDSVKFYINVEQFKQIYELECDEGNTRCMAYKLKFPMLGGVINIESLIEVFEDPHTSISYEFLHPDKINNVTLENPIKFLYRLNNGEVNFLEEKNINYISNYPSQLKKYNTENNSVEKIILTLDNPESFSVNI